MKSTILCSVSVIFCIMIAAVLTQNAADDESLSRIIHIVLPEGVSVSGFEVEESVMQFIEHLHAKALQDPWKCADWLKISRGISSQESHWVNSSYSRDMSVLLENVSAHKPANIEIISLYTQVAQALKDVNAMEDLLWNDYRKIVILVIAEDQSVEATAHQIIEQVPDDIFFYIIRDTEGGIKLHKFEAGTTQQVKVYENETLEEVLMFSVEPAPENACSEHYCSIHPQN